MPSSKRTRPLFFEIRVDATERQEFMLAAELAKEESVSAWARRILHREARKLLESHLESPAEWPYESRGRRPTRRR